MSLVRDIGITLPSLEERSLITCSTGNQAFSGNTGNNAQSTTAANGVAGRLIDRLGTLLVSRFQVAMPYTYLFACRGSTEPNRQLTIGVKLQHGDSSGGGDLVDYSTGSQPATRTYFTTARTSDMAVWDTALSTGPFYGVSDPAYYDLRGAKRYIAAVHIASKNRVTTESSGDEGARFGGGIVFLGGDAVPQNVNSTAPSSTSTST